MSALRVLVIEDEMTIAMMIEDMLAELGHDVVGAASRLKQAIAVAAEGDFDLAILDVNLDGRPSFPVAEILRGRGVPFLFATGYGAAGVDPAFAEAVVLRKPFLQGDLDQAIRRALFNAE